MRERVAVVTFSVCLSETDFEDGFILSLQTGIKAWQVMEGVRQRAQNDSESLTRLTQLLNEALFENLS